MNLDELEARARAHKRTTEMWATSLVDVALPGATSAHRIQHERNVAAFEKAEAQFVEALDPDTILHLIERARAGEAMRDAIWSEHDPLTCDTDRCGLCLSAARWESLAHSPQEAK